MAGTKSDRCQRTPLDSDAGNDYLAKQTSETVVKTIAGVRNLLEVVAPQHEQAVQRSKGAHTAPAAFPDPPPVPPGLPPQLEGRSP